MDEKTSGCPTHARYLPQLSRPENKKPNEGHPPNINEISFTYTVTSFFPEKLVYNIRIAVIGNYADAVPIREGKNNFNNQKTPPTEIFHVGIRN